MSNGRCTVYFLLDPLESLHGPLMPAYLVAKELKNRFDFVFVSQMADDRVSSELVSHGFRLINLGRHFFFTGSLRTLEAWLRRSDMKPPNAASLVVNCSQCFLADAHIYYAQGPIVKALDDMREEMSQTYRSIYWLMRRFFFRRDKSFVKGLREKSMVFVANSNFCARMYESWDCRVDKVIYPPLDCASFKPTTRDPSANYVLVYAGKETKFSILKELTALGLKFKVFGSKSPVPKRLLKDSKVEFLGKITDEELVRLYSNALFTLSVFTHEPFGYIPVESMACGTPVLTYGKQGPGESVLDKETGWFAYDDPQLVSLAARLWKDGYPIHMRDNCRKRALEFDAGKIAKDWQGLLEKLPGLEV